MTDTRTGTAPGGTRTFLFSDIEGSTRLLDELGSVVYKAVLERQAELLRAAFAAHGGHEEGTDQKRRSHGRHSCTSRARRERN